MEKDDYIKKIQFKTVTSDADKVYERIQSRIRRDEYFIGNKRISSLWKYISVAATIALLMVSSLWYLTEKRTEQVSYLEVTATSGSKTKVILPDSSEVWLNSNATLRYPQRFTSESRVVEMSGEALFEVKKNGKNPFVVQTNGLRIRVLGTCFNVMAEAGSDIVETTLLNGSVALFKDKNTTAIADKILKPGQQAIFYKSEGDIEVLPVRADAYSSWVSGVFNFEENTLHEIMRSLERAFDVKIHIENEKIKQMRFTAHFKQQETLDEILSILQISAHYSYTKKKGEYYIK